MDALAIFDRTPVAVGRLPIASFRARPSRALTMESSLFNSDLEQEDAPPERLCLVPGRDYRGQRIVQETYGLCGASFAGKDAAVRYVKSESADRQSAIRLSSDPVELNCSS